MAAKKTGAAKASMKTMPLRTLNTTTDKISPAVRRMVKDIDTELKKQAKESNIPVMQILGANVLNAESFFLNHMDYTAILGKNSDILDRMMMTAICSSLTEDILWSLTEAGVNYVGVWDRYTVYNILAAVVTFMKNDFDDELYLTAQQYAVISKEDLEKLPVTSYMPFSEYNPNRFVEQLMLIRAVAVDTIAGIMDNKLPKAFLSAKSDPIYGRLCKNYKTMMENDMKELLGEMDADTYLNQSASEKKISAFTEYFEKPFLVMCSILMQQSGLSENLINMALGMSHVHIIYDDPTDRKLGDIHIVVNLAAEKLPVGIEQPKTGFSISVADAILFALGDIDELPKSKKEPFGKAIRSLIISMCTYSINIYTRLMAYNRQAQETAFVTGMSVSEPNPEVEVNDMDEEDLKDILSEL